MFEAFRIPQFGFTFFEMDALDIKKISEITNINFAIDIKSNYCNTLDKKIAEVIEKIEGLPNFLLILKTTLDENSGDLEEVARITNKIING